MIQAEFAATQAKPHNYLQLNFVCRASSAMEPMCYQFVCVCLPKFNFITCKEHTFGLSRMFCELSENCRARQRVWLRQLALREVYKDGWSWAGGEV